MLAYDVRRQTIIEVYNKEEITTDIFLITKLERDKIIDSANGGVYLCRRR